MRITVTTGDISRHYDVSTGQEAVRCFFDDVKAGEIALSELGVIGDSGGLATPHYIKG